MASYQRALTLSPSSAGVHNNLGIVLCSLGKLEEAVAIYQAGDRVQAGLCRGT